MLIWALRIVFLVMFLAQSAVVVWACLQESLLAIPEPVLSNVWFVCTLYDIYFSFLTFALWALYRLKNNVYRVLWIFLVAGLGSVGIAGYMLMVLFRLPTHAKLSHILIREDHWLESLESLPDSGKGVAL
ncbi:MAG: DUF1475 domain-containing protein [Vampirovibrio sp.]|nr:DUF1475 domain-containing protein [Vampirovibrio sp.]